MSEAERPQPPRLRAHGSLSATADPPWQAHRDGDAAAAEPAREAAPPAPRDTELARPATARVNAHLVVLTLSMTAVFLMFVLIEPTPRWVLVLGAVVAVLGMEGTLRATWREPFRAPAGDTTPYLFLPALFVIAAPLIVEHNTTGYWTLAGGLLSGLGFGLVALAEIGSVRTSAPRYAAARLAATAGAYFAAFALFSMTYVFELGLPMAMAAVAVISLMLAIEVVREGQVDPLEGIVYSGVVALILAEARWTLQYLPVDGYLAGLALVLVFFVVTGLIHSYMTRHLDAVVAVEYALVGGAGLALVIVARLNGLA